MATSPKNVWHSQVASLERQKQELQACLESRAQAHQAQMDQLEARIDSDANQYSESAARVRALEGRCRDLERQVRRRSYMSME